MQRGGITLTGDLYDVVLLIYGGSFKESIYTEVSRRIKEYIVSHHKNSWAKRRVRDDSD